MLGARFDNFLNAYLVCALWSSTGDGGEPMDSIQDIGDFSPECLDRMTADCKSFFYRSHFYYESEDQRYMPGSPESHAGHDFWLTRCGHGAGFWDGDWPTYGELLTTLSNAYGNVDLYVGDDGKIYC